jgi:multicomponent Na+:H+ antiporter subunit D
MISNYLIIPILLPLLTAVVLLFYWDQVKKQRWISLFGHLLSFVSGIVVLYTVHDGTIVTMQAGNWNAPFGITFVADAFSGVLVLITAIVGLAVGVFSNASIGTDRVSYGYYPLLHFLQMGLYGSFLAGDLFNLYVWFEVIIIASFVLITLGGEKAQLEGAIKYVTMNLLASVIFLTGIAVLYGVLGSLNLADLSQKVSNSEHQGLINTTAVFFLVGFGIKSALFPMYFWLPDAYHTPPAAVSAIFGGLLTKVGVYAMIRVFSLLFIQDPIMRDILMYLAVLTMVTGAFGAIVSHHIRKIFSYLIVSHIGFMIAGLALFTPLAIAGAVYYMIHDIIAKTNAFMISGWIYKLKGNYHIKRLSGLYKELPLLSVVMAVALFSLVGTPPLSGFWPKLMLLRATIPGANWWVLGGIILASLLTLWAIVRMWYYVFWHEKPEQEIKHVNRFAAMSPRKQRTMLVPIIFLAFISLSLGLAWQPVSQFCKTVAYQITHKEVYIEAVLGNSLTIPEKLDNLPQ